MDSTDFGYLVERVPLGGKLRVGHEVVSSGTTLEEYAERVATVTRTMHSYYRGPLFVRVWRHVPGEQLPMRDDIQIPAGAVGFDFPGLAEDEPAPNRTRDGLFQSRGY